MGFAEFVWIIAISLGIITIFAIVPFEIAVNAIIISLAILALVWIHIARTSLSAGSSLRRFSTYIFICLIFMFFFSVWNLLENIIFPESYIGDVWLALAFLFLIVSSYKLMKIGVEFGFSAQARGIKKLLKKKKEKSK
jgi:hypothetical protein